MPARSDSAPVVVWGGGTGGVAAAVQAARAGAPTVLLTPGAWLGGMVSAAGVCCPDGNELTPWQTGLWGAFLRGVAELEPEGLDQNWVSCFGFQPARAEALLRSWVRTVPNLTWFANCRLLEVERSQRLVHSIRFERAGAIHQQACAVLIDGSDRGDLLPFLDLPFRFGWEAQEQWGEPSAPSQERLNTEAFFRDQPVQSPTWVVMGQLRSPDPAAQLDPTPELPAPFSHACDRFGLQATLTYGRLPGGLVMLNWPLHGNDWHWGLERAFSADPQQEAELYAEMQGHSLHFAQALEVASGGWLALGEAFPDEAGSPAPWLAAMPYWREGRRLIGRDTVIEQDLLPQGPGRSIAKLPLDQNGQVSSIAVGNYANDHHYPGGDWPLAPKSCSWGGRWTGTPFCVPYGALLSDTLDNLLAADKAFSTSHMANGATRLQPLIFNVGQAAGAAAALALENGVPPTDLAPARVQERLIHDPIAPSAVVPLWDTPWHHPQWANRQQLILRQPHLLSEAGTWKGASNLHDQPSFPPTSAIDRLQMRVQGELCPLADGGFELALDQSHLGRRRWKVISLEPAVDAWLQRVDSGTRVAMLGCFNPWGPWLRVSFVFDVL